MTLMTNAVAVTMDYSHKGDILCLLINGGVNCAFGGVNCGEISRIGGVNLEDFRLIQSLFLTKFGEILPIRSVICD